MDMGNGVWTDRSLEAWVEEGKRGKIGTTVTE